MHAYQATCVAIEGRGVLIEGEPGTGKSSLALALLDRGAELVGDDSLMIEVQDGTLFAHPHPATRGLLEVRNLGLLPRAVQESVAIALALRLDNSAPRFIDTVGNCTILGIPVPQVLLWPGSPVLHLKAELAVERYGLVV